MTAIEILRVIHISQDRRVLAISEYPGTASGVLIPVRAILADLLRLHSAGLVLSHNHPSGDPTPSRADIAATHAFARVIEALGVRLHDHLVRGSGRFVSFRELGLL
ncbi:MAG: JAB domain-containing protein [Sphingomonadaceae bacterium]